MKASFPGYYRPSKKEFDDLWKECVFVLDTSVLLNLYRYPKKASDELFAILKSLADRLWVPFHVGLEYQRNRPKAIAEQKRQFREVENLTNKLLSDLTNGIERLQIKERHSLIETDDLTTKIERSVKEFNRYLSRLEKRQIDVFDEDPLRADIDKLFKDRVGPSPKQETIDEILKFADTRYSYDIPPGFMDSKKGDDKYSYGGINYISKYGDLIIWRQILDHCIAKNIKKLIFINDDMKKDFVWKVQSQGEKNLGPHPLLVDEILRETSVTCFYIYNSTDFMKYSKEYLKTSVSEESIEQVRKISSQQRQVVPSKWGRMRPMAEASVGNWLTAIFPTNVKIEHGRNWPDFIVYSDYEGILGFEVVSFIDEMVWPHKVLPSIIKQTYNRSVDRGFSRVNLVVVGGSESHILNIKSSISESISSLPPGVDMIFGFISENRNSTIGYVFVEIDKNIDFSASPLE